MSRTTRLSAIFLLAAGVGACATPATGDLRPENNPSLYSAHQPVVERSDFMLDLRTGPEGVPASEIARLHGWFDSIGLAYGDRISVEDPQGYADPAARRDVAAAVAEYGLLLSDGAPVTSGNVQPGSVRVITSRATAHVPGCPDWGRRDIEATTTTSTNYGCATNANLAAMVANPEDLVLGQTGSGSGNAATATRAIRTLRNSPGGTRALPETRTTGGR